MRQTSIVKSLLLLVACSLCLGPYTGCFGGIPSVLMYVFNGYKIDAKCTALDGKRVAVVCVAGQGAGPADESEALSRMVGMLLEQNGNKIEVVRPEEVADWRDQNNWDQVDFKSIGRGVKADMVLAIELISFNIHDGSTLLRGKANIKTTVYDIQDKGKILYREGPEEFVYPLNGGQHAIDNEMKFKRLYLAELSQDIARNFYSYEKLDSVARDPAGL